MPTVRGLPFWMAVAAAHAALVAARLPFASRSADGWLAVSLVALGVTGQAATAVVTTVLAFRADPTAPRRQVVSTMLRIGLVFVGTFFAALLAGEFLAATVLTAVGKGSSEGGQMGSFFLAAGAAWIIAIAVAPRGATLGGTKRSGGSAAARRGGRFGAFASVACFAMPLPLEALLTLVPILPLLAAVAAATAGVLGAGRDSAQAGQPIGGDVRNEGAPVT